MNLKDFVLKYGISCRSLPVFPPITSDFGKEAGHFVVVLYHKGRSMTTNYSMGTGHRKFVNGEWLYPAPKLLDVLSCLRSDATIPNSFDEFCSDCGYNTDSIKAMRTFEACRKVADDLMFLLGDAVWFELLDCDEE